MLPALDLSIGQRLNFPSKYIYSENKTTSFFSPMEFSMLWHTTSKINNLHEVFLKACSSSKHVWSSGLTFPYGLAWFCWLSPERNMFEKICLLVTVRGPHDTNVWESATQFVFPPPTSSPEKLAAETLLVFLSNFFFFFYPISVWHLYWEKAADWVQRSEITLLPVDRRAHLCSVQTCQPCWVQNFIANSYNIITH